MGRMSLSSVFYFLFTLLLVGCDKFDRLEVKQKVAFIRSGPVKISSVTEIPWHVGDGLNTDITKGFQASVPFPVLSEQDIQTLQFNHKVDGFIMRINRQGATEGADLGTYFLPFSWLASYADGELQVNILYTVAYVRDSFEAQKCPDGGHRLKIEGIELVKSAIEGPQEFTVDMAPGSRAQMEFDKPRQGAIRVNGSKSLLGKYKFEVALYNSQSRYIYSSWKEIGGMIAINREIKVLVPGCDGY